MSKLNKDQRPVYLNVPHLASKMSITAKISILHRISGVLMVLAIPLVLYLLHLSLTNGDVYAHCYEIASLPIAKLIYLVLIWALMHHMCAGVRFLFIDINKGVEKLTAQRSARIVLAVSLFLTAILGVMIW